MLTQYNPILLRQDGETPFEHKLRLGKAKINKEFNLSWQEIVDILDLDCTADHLRHQIYAYMEYDSYLFGNDGVATRILAISDLHIPFQLPVETFKDYKGCIDILLINGDIFDMFQISKFPKAYRISPMEEIIVGRQYLIELIEYLSPSKVVITYGNHDLRFQSYFAKNLDTDLIELLPSTPIEMVTIDGFNHYDKRSKAQTHYDAIMDVFPDIEIVYTYDWKVKIGKTWFAHPTAFSAGALKTCEKAMAYFHNTDKEDFNCVVLGHTHRTAQEKIGYITLIEQGACCHVNQMHYNDGKLTAPQKMGYAFIAQDIEGNLIESKTKLVRLN